MSLLMSGGGDGRKGGVQLEKERSVGNHESARSKSRDHLLCLFV